MDVTVVLRALLLIILAVFALGNVGGWSAADVKREDVQQYAEYAADELYRGSNSLYESRLLNIIKAETQVVAGINYRFKLRMGELDCMRREHKELDLCDIQKTQICSVTVWVQEWMNFKEMTSFSCEDENGNGEPKVRLPRSSVGSQETIENINTEVTAAITFVVDHLTSLSNGQYRLAFHRLVTGTQQVVAGMYYRLNIDLVLSSCEKSEQGHLPVLTDCADNQQESVINCYAEVIDQAWMVPRHTLKQHRCQPVADSENTLYFHAHGQNPQVIGNENDVESREAFETFKQKYDKQYSSAQEEAARYKIFISNMKLAKTIQAFDQGTATYGATQFSDLTPEEFRRIYLPRQWDMSYDEHLKQAEIPKDVPPTAFDWRQNGAVTGVKNQGSCGSCWAFSVTGNVEGQWAIQKKELISLSEQELVDCDKLDEGCNGGLPSNAYQEIQRLGGLENETDYPYKGVDEKCNFVQQNVRVYINGSLNISKDEEEMKAWIFKNGPTSIGINAFAMQFYLGGISHPWKVFCAPDFLDHGVLIVGYGVQKGWFSNTPYWIIKNSWGSYWGEKGYYMVYRGAGVCGLNQMVSSALIN